VNEQELFDIEERLSRIEQGGVYMYYAPLTEAADEYVRFSQNPETRVYTGIPELDAEMRGVAAGETCVINGFAHNGKTVLATELILRNADKPIVLFTVDETRAAVLVKLTAAETGVGAEEMERRLYARDPDAHKLLMGVAQKFDRLVVYENNVTIHMMDRMLEEASNALGTKPVAFIFDYASLLKDDLPVADKLDALKAWGKQKQIAGFILHQSSRSAGAGGAEVTIDSGAFGGEQQATFLIGVRRKINFYNDQLRELQRKLDNTTNPKQQIIYSERMHEIRFDLIPRHLDTISVSLLKNKRPPMRLVPEIDFRLDKETGRIIKIEKDDPDEEPDKPLPLTYSSGSSAKELLGRKN
jgi:hypothetical protein